jgi:hypothetical protein
MDARAPVSTPRQHERLQYTTAVGWLVRGPVLAAAFLAPYAVWRIFADWLFTVSDALFVIAASFAVASRQFSVRPFQNLTPYWYLSIGTMIFALGISSLINGDPVRFAIVGVQYAFAYLLLPGLLVPKRSEDRTKIIVALVAGVTVMEAFAIAVYYGYSSDPADLRIFGHDFITGRGRVGAFVSDPNWNGATIAMTLPFVFYLSATKRLPMIAVIPIAAILGVATMLTGSVTAFGSSLAALIIFIVAANPKKAWKPILGGALATTLLLASGFKLPAVFQERVLTAVTTGDISQAGTFVGRMELIREALEISEETTIVGLGVDQYRVISRDKAPVHNVFLLLWTEGGMLALAGWVSAMALLFLATIRTFFIDRINGALSLSVGLAFIMQSLASPSMYARFWAVPLIIAAGVAMAATKRQPIVRNV